MSERITISGVIGTVPRRPFAKNGAPITSFRLASRQSHFDRAKDEWVDDNTSWYTVSTFRHLATNAAQSLSKGEHVVVTGKLFVRNWTNAERSGTDVDIVADAIGHDLAWYTTTPVRAGLPARAKSEQTESEPAESAESAESATAYEDDFRQLDGSADGFVPDATDADRDSFARLDS
ncbi:single-stranded DNA-binding protein [Cryobacterium sp. Y50]|uniref:single-stranded DNA-binding protein n=1 Tax=Cryobacterium sp. Y50 TaxID=2048286 RepID=UPI000CE51F80|nr:single-stranded DNA-binding protein [Cryobacterium sp. Y50]